MDATTVAVDLAKNEFELAAAARQLEGDRVWPMRLVLKGDSIDRDEDQCLERELAVALEELLAAVLSWVKRDALNLALTPLKA